MHDVDAAPAEETLPLIERKVLELLAELERLLPRAP